MQKSTTMIKITMKGNCVGLVDAVYDSGEGHARSSCRVERQTLVNDHNHSFVAVFYSEKDLALSRWFIHNILGTTIPRRVMEVIQNLRSDGWRG